MNIKQFNNLNDELSGIRLIFTNKKTTTTGEINLYSLLIHHPYFIKKVNEIRLSLNIPKDSFEKPEAAYLWEHKNDNKNKLTCAAKLLASDFNITDAYKHDIEDFINNYILCKWRTDSLLDIGSNSKEKIDVKVIKASLNREINGFIFMPGKTYLEVSPESSSRSVNRAYKEIVKMKKQIQPYKINRPLIIAEMPWEKGQEGLNGIETKDYINKKLGTFLASHEIPIYKKRYKEALKKLRDF